MVLNMLFDNYDLLMDSPNSTVKMRKLILQLAVQGKLVEQDPTNEPASELLKHIKAEKEKLIAEGKIKKQKPLPPITEDEILYELPRGWEWVRLGDICNQITDGTHHTPHYVNQGVPFLSVKDISKGKIDFSNTRFVTKEEHEKLIKRCKPEFENILFTKVGTTGIAKVVDVNVEFSIFVSVALLKFSKDKLYPYFLEYLLNSPLARKQSAESTQGIGNKNLVIRDIARFLIPIPPLTEQKRIVSKVDQLMQICDQLDACQKKASTKYESLNDAALEKLLSAKNLEEFAEHWQFLCNDFELIYNDPAHVNKLRRAILQLAVQGKLAPQDPNDEPASVLLEKIGKEKERLVKEGKIKKQKPLPDISKDEKPFDLPAGWEFVRLQETIDVRDGTHDSPKDAIGQDTYPLVTSKNFDNGTIKFDEARRISSEDHFNISKRSFVERYDILFSMIGGNLGNQVMVIDDRPFSVKNVALFKYYDRELTSPFYIKKFMEHLALYLQSKAVGGAQPFVSLGFLRKLVIALPPVAEQHRIVAKVDELMALCDTLKARLNDAQTTQVQLADAVVEQAVA